MKALTKDMKTFCANCGKSFHKDHLIKNGFCSLRCYFDFNPNVAERFTQSIIEPEKEEDHYLDEFIGE